IIGLAGFGELLDQSHDALHVGGAQARVACPQAHPMALRILRVKVDRAAAQAGHDLAARLLEHRVQRSGRRALAVRAGEQRPLNPVGTRGRLLALLLDAGYDARRGHPDEAALLEQREVVVELRLLRVEVLGELLRRPRTAWLARDP